MDELTNSELRTPLFQFMYSFFMGLISSPFSDGFLVSAIITFSSIAVFNAIEENPKYHIRFASVIFWFIGWLLGRKLTGCNVMRLGDIKIFGTTILKIS